MRSSQYKPAYTGVKREAVADHAEGSFQPAAKEAKLPPKEDAFFTKEGSAKVMGNPKTTGEEEEDANNCSICLDDFVITGHLNTCVSSDLIPRSETSSWVCLASTDPGLPAIKLLTNAQPTFPLKCSKQSHIFCFDCIKLWSETENSCPLCKAKFNEITKRDPADLDERLECANKIIHVLPCFLCLSLLVCLYHQACTEKFFSVCEVLMTLERISTFILFSSLSLSLWGPLQRESERT